MTTLTPGDNEVKENNVNNLSARLLVASRKYMDAIEEVDEVSPGRKLVAARNLRAAIAALSALPAGGGESVWMFKDRQGQWCAFSSDKHRENTIASGEWEVRQFFTTPQPSAAEEGWGFSYKQPWHAQEDAEDYESWAKQERQREDTATRLGSAAVGAQGAAVAKVIRVTPMGPIVEWYDNQPVGTELFAHAAPAAGKGADAEELRKLIFLWRIREDNGEELTEFDKGYEQASDEHAAHLEAALTRQPVAGDGK